ncbi:MAG: patatin-like phospholipase family protein [Chloroflexota bacterium]|nr:patatin-like phospholipase family protein [Chloroflexota bacterium]
MMSTRSDSAMSSLGRTALVLAGGGISGAVYEIGALRAIDHLLLNRTVNDFDIFVGTSAGALIASLLANGISSVDLMRVVNATHPLVEFPEPKDLFRFNTREFVRRGLALPARLAFTGKEALALRRRLSVLDIVFSGLGDALPSGIYDIMGYGDWIENTIKRLGGSDRFDALAKELHIVATQLGNGRRTVFSAQTPDVTIPLAVAASSAIPVVYKPVRIGNREYIDGGIRGTASLDVAIEHGAKLVVCINSLVPFDSRGWEEAKSAPPGELISQRGLEAVSAQTTRVLVHAGLKYHIKQLQRRHPDVDIILIEPKPDDSTMFFANIMRLQDRISIAEHGFRSVSVDLAGGYEHFRETLARYDIKISRGLVMADLEEIRQAGHDPAVVQGVLERSGQPGEKPPGHGSAGESLKQLERTLVLLEKRLDELAE